MAENPKIELPVLAYLGAGRVWSQKREKAENVFRKHYFRTVGYTAARFMNYMEESSDHKIFYDKQEEQLMYQTSSELLPIDQLSAGYQSLIWTVFDIAYRMAVLNPDKRERIAETKGVVLIDELDMHLHPRWQWNVIEALRKTFPNVQFIAATHAPILFASAKNVWLIDMNEESIQYEYSHYGIDVNTSMTVYQGTKEIPKNVEKQVKEFCEKMDQEKYAEAEKILNALENETAPTHPLLTELRTRYEFETTDWEE